MSQGEMTLEGNERQRRGASSSATRTLNRALFRAAVLFNLKWEYAVVLAMLAACVTSSAALAAPDAPKTPVRHVIVIVGENHSFDNLFGVYRPASGQSVFNLLSEG
jgi:phospholipase C